MTPVTERHRGTRILPARIHRPSTVDEVVRTLHEHPSAQLVAGATWILRSHLRNEPVADDLVLLSGDEGLDEVEPGDPEK